jgi:hypothetical protein
MKTKTMLKAAIAAVAMIGGATAAYAGPSDKVVYGAQFDLNGGAPGGVIAPNAEIFRNQTYFFVIPGNVAIGIVDAVRNALPDDAKGARYEQSSNVAGNTESAVNTISADFVLSGTVSTDCSFYTGGVSSQTINLGTIGIQTGNNVNNTLAFDQVGPITANINTSTAGCNTQNTVTIAKQNGTQGLVNPTSVAYATDQFTNHIQYEAKASWSGVGATSGPSGPQTLTAGLNDAGANANYGAWRSQFDLDITAPPAPLGLLAGTYSDTVKVTLAAF